LALVDVVPGSSGVHFCDAITSGTFINTSAVGKSSVVPKLSMMLLLRFAHAQGASSPLYSAILGMAAAEEVGCGLPRPSLGGEPFETFVRHLLRLSTCLEDESDRSLREFLHVSLDELKVDRIPVRELLLRRVSRDFKRHSEVQLGAITFAAAVRHSTCTALDSAGLFSFVKNNPAFDVLYLSGPRTDKCRFAVAFEARITTPAVDSRGGGCTVIAGSNADTEFEDSIAKVEKKVALLHSLCTRGGTFDNLGIMPENVLYVYLTARTITGYTAAVRAAYLARGVVVLDRAAAEVFLTPTLSGCLLFQERIKRARQAVC